MNFLKKRILLIYPYSNIDTNPTMALLLESLSNVGVEVDVFVDDGAGYPSSNNYGKNVYLKKLPEEFFCSYGATLKSLPKRVARLLLTRGSKPFYPISLDPALLGLLGARRYAVVIGVDPLGIVTADRIARSARKPLVYISFEIMFTADLQTEGEMCLRRYEEEACKRTSLLLIQDSERAGAFCKEHSFSQDKIVMVPVAPPPETATKSDYLRRKLGISPERRIVLLAGSVATWASRDELAEMVSYWPNRYCLVIHSRATVSGRMERYLKDLTCNGNIYVSFDPVSRQQMTTLISSADYGLAPYRVVPDSWMTAQNLVHLGLASGKVAYYTMCGLPILARSLAVFEREFSKFQCGKVYQKLAETGSLLDEMDAAYECYSGEARRFYNERLNPLSGMDEFCSRIIRLADGGDMASS